MVSGVILRVETIHIWEYNSKRHEKSVTKLKCIKGIKAIKYIKAIKPTKGIKAIKPNILSLINSF